MVCAAPVMPTDWFPNVILTEMLGVEADTGPQPPPPPQEGDHKAIAMQAVAAITLKS